MNSKTASDISIILASASPRRKELLSQIALKFQVLVSHVEEKITTDIPWKLVEDLSKQKALACYEMVSGSEERRGAQALSVKGKELMQDCLIIGADTVVYAQGHILGKPKDAEDAMAMLQSLQGKAHQVYTGVTLLYCKEAQNSVLEKNCSCKDGITEPALKIKTFHECTTVRFYPMTEEEIRDYVATGEPLDKAGAYGIQGVFARFVQGIEGDYCNVVGLPVSRLYQEAKEWL